ncbi:MAG: flippase-like domain-containing protein, partial [Salinibacterium sp.]|nr:flippase-like domain-containing protein [Salinibacterium sp.]
FLQVASIVPSVAIIAIVLGGAVFTENPGTLVLPLLLAAPLLVVLIPRVLLRVLDAISPRLLKSAVPREYVLSGWRTVGFAVAYVIPRLINAGGFVVLSASIVPVDPSEWLLFAAAYTLAGAIGILAVFVPSGIGVREGVLFAVLVAGGATPTDAVIVALAARLLSTLSDAVLGLAWVGLRIVSRKDHNDDEGP